MRLTRVLRDVPWRRVLALFVACLVCTALWAEATQVRLASQVIRLHVLANSDSEEDQALKLEVRDRVLETTSALLAGETEPQAAAVLLDQHLDDIAQTAAQEISSQGHDDRVEVRLEQTWFPTRQYQGISLPAGNYLALRVLIGAAEGHNWWCVVFPNLCLPAVSERALEASTLTPGQISLLQEEETSYVFRFKALELWQSLKHRLMEG
ncbi:stage II sporulation protein R [Evtepia sp.]|uniref:stage II sporulation protein R n=1 Tax=Evtepia sp. TaxID=2773933 RepID=UPI002E75A3FC|nr:stage II sporulation protein R [Evtepia sp.]MEE0257836.1 stage II sporulation protein R [Evtepia sp.]